MPNNRGLAFYKADGKPWTKEEYYKILNYVGEPSPFDFNEDRVTFKYIYTMTGMAQSSCTFG